MKLYESILEELSKIKALEIPNERKVLLHSVIQFLNEKKGIDKLTFICTHNSRRSQLAQVWATVANAHFNKQYHFFSGGTEETNCHPTVIEALKASGLKVTQDKTTGKEIKLKYGESETMEVELFSKVYDHSSNPQKDFVAIMTCDHADENCPFIPGASHRLPLHYSDPKEHDGSPHELDAYIMCSQQIASEMFYLISQLHGK